MMSTAGPVVEPTDLASTHRFSQATVGVGDVVGVSRICETDPVSVAEPDHVYGHVAGLESLEVVTPSSQGEEIVHGSLDDTSCGRPAVFSPRLPNLCREPV